MNRTHDLKTQPDDFEAIQRGDKTHEARKDDRAFAVGDVLRLREWRPDDPAACAYDGAALPGTYTGRTLDVDVTHVTRGQCGLPPDLAVMSVAKRGSSRAFDPRCVTLGPLSTKALETNRDREVEKIEGFLQELRAASAVDILARGISLNRLHDDDLRDRFLANRIVRIAFHEDRPGWRVSGMSADAEAHERWCSRAEIEAILKE